MKPGQGSRTAVLVCMGRAVAHGSTSVARFEDPTAIALLSDDARARVERVRADVPPKGLRARFDRMYLRRQSQMMAARTVAIDDAIRDAGALQLTILGAGLDGRAWRMAALKEAVVFEVDHPDTQRDKRARVARLTQAAREVAFVPVDFARDDLDAALANAGHDPKRPTTWVWEGVVMYLSLAEVEATLAVIERRSAAGSRLVVAYHSPAAMLRIVGAVLGRFGEPLRSAFTADEMRALLGKHGFRVVRDDDIPTIAASLSPEAGRDTRVIRHLRIAVADKRAVVASAQVPD